MRSSTLLILLLMGCAGPQPLIQSAGECAPDPDPAIQFDILVKGLAYQVGRPMVDACASEHQVVKFFTETSELPLMCRQQAEGFVLGCNGRTIYGVPHIWVRSCGPHMRRTLRHERLHTLLECLGIDGGDANHLSDYWDLLRVR